LSDRLHSHYFRGVTSYNDGHIHRYSGTTSQDRDTPGHVHTMTGETTFEDGHVHSYSLMTGAPIPVANGHTHYYKAATAFNDGHTHNLTGYTTVYEL